MFSQCTSEFGFKVVIHVCQKPIFCKSMDCRTTSLNAFLSFSQKTGIKYNVVSGFKGDLEASGSTKCLLVCRIKVFDKFEQMLIWLKLCRIFEVIC
jgi:hypothetical protein